MRQPPQWSLEPLATNSGAEYEARLEQRIEELERQVARLQDAFKTACHVADDRRNPKPHAAYYPDMLGEQALAEIGLHTGDLDPI